MDLIQVWSTRSVASYFLVPHISPQLPCAVKHLHQHLMLLLPVCGDILDHTASVILKIKSTDDDMEEIEGG